MIVECNQFRCYMKLNALRGSCECLFLSINFLLLTFGSITCVFAIQRPLDAIKSSFLYARLHSSHYVRVCNLIRGHTHAHVSKNVNQKLKVILSLYLAVGNSLKHNSILASFCNRVRLKNLFGWEGFLSKSRRKTFLSSRRFRFYALTNKCNACG